MRQWGKKEDGAEGATEGGAKPEEDKKDKLPKRKVAALIGYNGINYKGSQVFVSSFLFLHSPHLIRL
jgi:tRNA pseudouridine38-40 synthase